jgi:hypothetical protein
MPPLRNLWKYYPKIKGTCTGFVLCGFGFSSVILNKVSKMIINPDHVKIDKTTEFYPDFIGKRVPKYFFITSIIIISFGLFASLFIFQYEEKKQNNLESYINSEIDVIEYLFFLNLFLYLNLYFY